MIQSNRATILEQCLADLEYPEESPTLVSATGTLKPDFPGFEGHFPEKPLLAGAYQIELITAIASRLIEPTWVPTCIEHARFRKMLRPGDPVELQASLAGREPGRVRVKAVLLRNAQKACQATIIFST